MAEQTKQRIIFLDLMRAFAVLMMVQGHTTDTFLANEYRNIELIGYKIWISLRGFTAPIFMFTSGTVFTYLLLKNNLPFAQNPRVRKGFFRFLLLLFLGYILRYPTFKLFDFSNVSAGQWRIFFAVDALHLIGFGLLFVLVIYYLSGKIKIPVYLPGIIVTLFFFLITPQVRAVNWSEIFPAPVAAYFFRKTGSIFPLFPYAGYVTAGAILGYILAVKPMVQRSRKFCYGLLSFGLAGILLTIVIHFVLQLQGDEASFWSVGYRQIFFRLFVVVFLNGLFATLVINVKHIPNIIQKIGANTLLIYVIHLVILYGSAWNPGFYRYMAKTFSIGQTAFAVIIMISLMITIVIIKEKYLHLLKLPVIKLKDKIGK